MKPLPVCFLLTLACATADDRWTLYRAAIAAADGALRLNETASAQAWLRATPEEHRGWEYRYLKAMSNRSVATLTAHDAAITGLAIDSSGELAATTSQDNTMRVWNAALGTEVAVFQGHMWSPVFRPKTRELAAVGPDGAVRVWSLATRRELRQYRANARAVAWSSDGKFLVASSGELWDFEQDKLLWKSEREFRSVSFHPTKPEFVASTGYGVVSIYAIDGAGKPRVDVSLPDASSVVFTEKGFAAATGDGSIHEFDSQNGKLLRVYRGHNLPASAVAAFGPWIASGSGDQSIRIWNGASSMVLQGHNAPITALAVTPDGSRILSGDASGRIYWWDTLPVLGSEWKAGTAEGFAFAPDGRRAVLVSTGMITLHDASSGKVIWLKQGKSAAFSPDGKQLAFSNQYGHLQIADTATGEVRTTWEAGLSVSAIAWSPNGAWIFGGGKVWDSKTGKVLHQFVGPGVANGAAFSKDSRRLLLAWTHGQFSMIDLTSGSETKADGAPGGAIQSVAFHPDGATFATAGGDRTLRIFDTATLKLQRQIDGHTDRVYSLDFSPDGKRLVSASADQTVRLWDVATGENLLRIPFGALVRLVRFSPDGARIAAAPTDGRLVILGYR